MNSTPSLSSPPGSGCALGLFLAVASIVPQAWAETLPARGTVDSRIRVAPYSADQVYRLYGFVGYQIDLEFEPDESFVGVGAGDIEGITFGAHDNHLILKPKAVNVGMNLTVFTNRRHYHFEYSAWARRPDPVMDEVIYALRFTYPPAISKVDPAMEAGQIEGKLAAAPATRPRNVDYWYCGDKTVKPVAASDDGVHTRLRFGAKAELPAIFVRNEDGTESLLNFNIEEGDVIVHRVARQFVVRRGKLMGCIVNKGFAGAGERLESGTVSSDVKRATKGERP